jgi:opacity protein-like surface antigen
MKRFLVILAAAMMAPAASLAASAVQPPEPLPVGQHVGPNEGEVRGGAGLSGYISVRQMVAEARRHSLPGSGFLGRVTYGKIVTKGPIRHRGTQELPFTRSGSQTYVTQHAPGQSYVFGTFFARFVHKNLRCCWTYGWTQYTVST